MRHMIDTVGVLLIAWGALWLFSGLLPAAMALFNAAIGLFAVYDATQGGHGAPQAAAVFLGSSFVWIVAGLVVAAIGLVSVLTGIGMRRRSPMSRYLAGVIGILSLPLCFPLGALFGVMILIVVFDAEVAKDFAGDADVEF